MEQKMDSQTERLNFIEKLYFTIVDLFCRYKSDNNMNITYINRLQQCRQSLVSKILLDIITPCAKISCFVSTSHLVWHSHPLQSITTQITHGKSKARQGMMSFLQSFEIAVASYLSRGLARMISYSVFSLALDPPRIIYVAIEGWLRHTG